MAILFAILILGIFARFWWLAKERLAYGVFAGFYLLVCFATMMAVFSPELDGGNRALYAVVGFGAPWSLLGLAFAIGTPSHLQPHTNQCAR